MSHSKIVQRRFVFSDANRVQSIATNMRFRAAPLPWPTIAEKAGRDVLQDFYQYPDSKPSTTSTPLVAGRSADTKSSKPVLFYRDTNGWCPYCQIVWMALLEKKIPFEAMMIDLRNKPEWYPLVASNNKTPAVKFGDEVMVESIDIVLALEDKFPQIPLLPSDANERQAAKDFMRKWSAEYSSKLFRPTLMKFVSPSNEVNALPAEVGEVWAVLEGLLEEHGGDFLFGDLSVVDLQVAVSAMRLRSTVSHSPTASAKFPRLTAWFDAMAARESWKKTCVDDATYSLLLSKLDLPLLSGVELPKEAGMSHIGEEEMTARREAAAKIAANRDVIAEKLVKESGVLREVGSVLGSGYSNINGYMMTTRKGSYLEEAQIALQRVCNVLLTDQLCDRRSRDSAAVQVAMLAYFANLTASPRDVTAAAAIQLRAACHKVISGSYMP